MPLNDISVAGLAEVLPGVGEQLYVRMVTGDRDDLVGHRRDGAVAWVSAGPAGPAGYAVGAPEQAFDLLTELVETGPLAGARWAHLPRMGAAGAIGGRRIARRDDWDFRWTHTPPAPQIGEDRVVALAETDHPALDELIDRAFPASTSRPGGPRVIGWYGIRSRGRLVACGADRSRGGVGFLAGLCVAPEVRGQGLGAALTAGMTRMLLARHGRVALGVLADNHPANRIYTRLGFSTGLARTSVMLG